MIAAGGGSAGLRLVRPPDLTLASAGSRLAAAPTACGSYFHSLPFSAKVGA